MNLIKEYAGLVAVVAILLMFLFGGSSATNLGGAACNGGNCTDFDAVNTSAGYFVDDTEVLDGTGDATIFGGNLTVTTSNTATSTIIVGCFQSYATSTATALKLMFTASSTAPTNGSGIIPVISYGTCP